MERKYIIRLNNLSENINANYAYNNLNEKIKQNPSFGPIFANGITSLTQDQVVFFALLIAIADNKRKAQNMNPLTIEEVIELVGIYAAQYPIVNSLYASEPQKSYIFKEIPTDINSSFNEDFIHFTSIESKVPANMFNKDIVLAEDAYDFKFSLEEGEYEVKVVPLSRKAKKDKKEVNVADNLNAKALSGLRGIFGRDELVTINEIEVEEDEDFDTEDVNDKPFSETFF